MSREMLLLGREEIAGLFTLTEYIDTVEAAFKAHAEGRTLTPALLHVDSVGGEFHVKAGGIAVGERSYFGLKANGGFFGNPASGLPAIQGIIYLADATDGSPLAILDSGHITVQRTGAATAVAAKYLARADARIVTVCGVGRQGRIQLEALGAVRHLTRAYVWSRHPASAARFAEEMSAALGIAILPVLAPVDGARWSDIVVTCTPSRRPILDAADLVPGTFVAAVGSDSPDKQELDPNILAAATVVTDLTAQCAHVGELHHGIAAGLVAESDVHAELGEIIAGRKPGRCTAEEITVYDATGTALQDTACAAAIYEKAMAIGVGTMMSLNSQGLTT